MTKVGICILSWNSGSALVSCIEGVEAQQLPLRMVIAVVDNASPDHAATTVREHFPWVHVIENRSNIGYAAGNNVGARYLLDNECDFLVFLNPDVLLEHGSLWELIRGLELSPHAGCAGGVPLTPVGKFDAAARTRPTALEQLVVYGPLWRVPALMDRCRGHLINHKSVANGDEIYATYGACIAFRSAAFCDMQWFDERTFLYFEEFITAERLQRTGWRTILCTAARYSHAVGASTDLIPYRRRLHLIASEQYLLRTYYGYSPLGLAAFRAYRCFEWLIYCAYTWSVRSLMPLSGRLGESRAR